MIKWILFDQGNVQTHFIFSKEKKYSVNGKVFLAEDLESIFHTSDYNEFVRGKIDEKEVISNFLKNKALNLTIKEYISLLKEGINAQEGMKEILELLFKKYNLATLINEGTAWANYKLDVPHFRKFFKLNIISGELGIKKPDLKFFDTAIKQINAKPEECIFIDDDLKNIAAGKSFGFNSILFTSPEKLKMDLVKLGIF